MDEAEQLREALELALMDLANRLDGRRGYAPRTAEIIRRGEMALAASDHNARSEAAAENARLRAFAENVRDNWGALTGYELQRDARAALAAGTGAAVGEGTTTYSIETGCDTCGCPTLVDDRCWGCKRVVADTLARPGEE